MCKVRATTANCGKHSMFTADTCCLATGLRRCQHVVSNCGKRWFWSPASKNSSIRCHLCDWGELDPFLTTVGTLTYEQTGESEDCIQGLLIMPAEDSGESDTVCSPVSSIASTDELTSSIEVSDSQQSIRSLSSTSSSLYETESNEPTQAVPQQQHLLDSGTNDLRQTATNGEYLEFQAVRRDLRRVKPMYRRDHSRRCDPGSGKLWYGLSVRWRRALLDSM